MLEYVSEYHVVISSNSIHENELNLAINRPNGSGDYLFVLFESDVDILINGIYERHSPGACVFFAPGQPQCYTAIGCLANDYIHFTAKNDLIHLFNLRTSHVYYPANTKVFSDIIKDITVENLVKPPMWSTYIDSLITRLLIEFGRGDPLSRDYLLFKIEPQVYNVISDIRLQMLNHPNMQWDIEMLCKNSFMSRSQFFKLYKELYKSTPTNELINARINLAKTLLTDSTLSITSISQLSGYSNVYHFIRQFKKIVGITPSVYKNNFYNQLK